MAVRSGILYSVNCFYFIFPGNGFLHGYQGFVMALIKETAKYVQHEFESCTRHVSPDVNVSLRYKSTHAEADVPARTR